MGRGTLWAANAGPDASPETLETIVSDLNITTLAPPLVASVVFRHVRTLCNLTQREYGILISPEGTAPISASVVCQLETGTHNIPASLVTRAAAAATAVQTFADWRREAYEGCYDSQLSALRALGPGCEAELQPYLDRKGELPDRQAALVAQYLEIVSKRKQTGSGDRPATRGPYKKSAKKNEDGSEAGSSPEEGSAADGAAKPAATARGPRGPYKMKRKARPMGVGLATGEVSPAESSSSSSSLSSPATPSTTRSDSNDSLSAPSADETAAADDFDALRSPGGTAADGGSELSLFKECLGDSGAAVTPRTHAATVDFLARLENAEQRDQVALDSARESETTAAQRRLATAAAYAPGRSPRDSPRGDCKRRATRKAQPKAQPLVKGAQLPEELAVVDLDKLNIDDFSLDALMASPRSETGPLQSVDEVMELVCKEMESPRWSDFDYDGMAAAECAC